MKTPGTQVEILYQLFNGSGLKTVTPGKITGDVYKVSRPNSQKEDIVIKSLSLVGQTKQFGSAVVNIWIPDKQLKERGVADTKRIDVLSALAVELLSTTISPDYNITIANQLVIDEQDLKYHYYSITVNFEFFNL